MLHSRRASGATENVARVDTLLSIMSRLDDTCLLYRGGKEALVTAKAGAAAVESAGGSGNLRGRPKIFRLDPRLLGMAAPPVRHRGLSHATAFIDSVHAR